MIILLDVSPQQVGQSMILLLVRLHPTLVVLDAQLKGLHDLVKSLYFLRLGMLEIVEEIDINLFGIQLLLLESGVTLLVLPHLLCTRLEFLLHTSEGLLLQTVFSYIHNYLSSLVSVSTDLCCYSPHFSLILISVDCYYTTSWSWSFSCDRDFSYWLRS
jgi:hypothetical protein